MIAKIGFCFFLILTCCLRSTATQYFISSLHGDDKSDGRSSKFPWKTIQKLSFFSSQIQPGDSILLERGSIFFESLDLVLSGSTENKIFIGAFGTGEKPVLSGLIGLKTWSPFKRNIWVSECPECLFEPTSLLINGIDQLPGRFPNHGYRPLLCSTDCQTSMEDLSMPFPDGYWNTAEVVVKSSRWTLDNIRVVSYANKVFNFSTGTTYPLPKGYGYFIQKHLATLDQNGEWFFDPRTKQLYLHQEVSPARQGLQVNIGIHNGLTIRNSKNLIIKDIIISHARATGLTIINSDYIMLNNCEIRHSGHNGLEVTSCTNCHVENSTIADTQNNGVLWDTNTGGKFHRNAILRTGLRPGRGDTGNGTYIALSIHGPGKGILKNSFQYNRIDSTGYLGIDFRTGGNTIKNNYISNFCLVKDDGAGIYTWGNTAGNNIVEGNIVTAGIGCGEGTAEPDHRFASGIYIDDLSTGVTVINNTAAYCATAGIYLHNASNIVVTGNMLYGNAGNSIIRERGQLYVKLDNLPPDKENAPRLKISGNTFIATGEDSYCVYLSSEQKNDLKALGSFSSNQYVAADEKIAIAKFYTKESLCEAPEQLRLVDWQRSSKQDKRSTFKKLAESRYKITGPNLLARNSDWVTWPVADQISIERSGRSGNRILHITIPEDGDDMLIYYGGIMLDKNKQYKLEFSARALHKSTLEFVPLMAQAPWEALDNYTCFAIDTIQHDYRYIFTPDRTYIDARMNFKAGTSIWLSNLRLEEISGKLPSSFKLVLNATEKAKTVKDNSFTELNGRQGDTLTIPPYGSSVMLKKSTAAR